MRKMSDNKQRAINCFFYNLTYFSEFILLLNTGYCPNTNKTNALSYHNKGVVPFKGAHTRWGLPTSSDIRHIITNC